MEKTKIKFIMEIMKYMELIRKPLKLYQMVFLRIRITYIDIGKSYLMQISKVLKFSMVKKIISVCILKIKMEFIFHWVKYYLKKLISKFQKALKFQRTDMQRIKIIFIFMEKRQKMLISKLLKYQKWINMVIEIMQEIKIIFITKEIK